MDPMDISPGMIKERVQGFIRHRLLLQLDIQPEIRLGFQREIQHEHRRDNRPETQLECQLSIQHEHQRETRQDNLLDIRHLIQPQFQLEDQREIQQGARRPCQHQYQRQSQRVARQSLRLMHRQQIQQCSRRDSQHQFQQSSQQGTQQEARRPSQHQYLRRSQRATRQRLRLAYRQHFRRCSQRDSQRQFRLSSLLHNQVTRRVTVHHKCLPLNRQVCLLMNLQNCQVSIQLRLHRGPQQMLHLRSQQNLLLIRHHKPHQIHPLANLLLNQVAIRVTVPQGCRHWDRRLSHRRNLQYFQVLLRLRLHPALLRMLHLRSRQSPLHMPLRVFLHCPPHMFLHYSQATNQVLSLHKCLQLGRLLGHLTNLRNFQVSFRRRVHRNILRMPHLWYRHHLLRICPLRLQQFHHQSFHRESRRFCHQEGHRNDPLQTLLFFLLTYHHCYHRVNQHPNPRELIIHRLRLVICLR
mmetsp:Transcript_17924/g.36742  ORF Transcript_17924/g.36742 Transcript_17924/m.36742 type:complete len:466 (-) Transcript_17924:1143-2540(-)